MRGSSGKCYNFNRPHGAFPGKPHMSFYVLGIKILTIRLLRSNTSQPSLSKLKIHTIDFFRND